MPEDSLKTEQEISDCYLEGTLKHSGSISGFIHVFTQLVKNSKGDGSLIKTDADEALSRLLGELSSVTLDPMRTKRDIALRVPQGDKWAKHGCVGDITDTMNRIYWLTNEAVPPPVEEVIAQAAECLADPNFFIAEISGIISALVELQSVCHQRMTLRVPLRGMKSNVGGYHKSQGDIRV